MSTVSIITVCRNAVATLGNCLDSVAAQTLPPLEQIVIDGRSTDGTVDLIQGRGSNLIRWISEPDDGIGDAMNKGAARAEGDWLLFLHADDYLADDQVLAVVGPYLTDDFDIVAGSIIFMYPETGQKELRRPRGFVWRNRTKTQFYHQAVFIRRDYFKKLGGYDTSFTITMDYDFFLRAHNDMARLRLITETISVMRRSGISSQVDWSSLKHRFEEERRCHYKQQRTLSSKLGYALYWLIYPLFRRIKSSIMSR